MKAMIFLDYENFWIATNNYYRKILKRSTTPRLNYDKLPIEIVRRLPQPHSLVKTFIFAPKPDDFLMEDESRVNAYNWLHSLNDHNFLSVVEGRHVARPTGIGEMDVTDPTTYYVEEKGTDVNLAVHVLTKAFHNSFDTAIIVSADSDHIPIMDVLNEMGKSVVVVGVVGQNLSKQKQHSDMQIYLSESNFNRCLLYPSYRFVSQ